MDASVLHDQLGNVERLQRLFHFGEDVWEIDAGIFVISLTRIGPSYIRGAFWSLFKVFENSETYYFQINRLIFISHSAIMQHLSLRWCFLFNFCVLSGKNKLLCISNCELHHDV